MIRVLVADDQALVRAGFARLIASEDDMTVAGEAADGRAAVDLTRRGDVDVVLMDIRMPELDGLEATRQITAIPELSATRILILTTFDLDEYVYEALRGGASGFLLKDTDPAQLVHAIRTVVNGGALIAPTITKRLIAAYAAAPDREWRSSQDLDLLTVREQEVLRLVAGGLSNDEIAQRLFISPLTAKTHVGRILTKLHCRDRTQLVVFAYETGFVTPGQPSVLP